MHSEKDGQRDREIEREQEKIQKNRADHAVA